MSRQKYNGWFKLIMFTWPMISRHVPNGDSLRLDILLGTNNGCWNVNLRGLNVTVTGIVRQWKRYLISQNVFLVFDLKMGLALAVWLRPDPLGSLHCTAFPIFLSKIKERKAPFIATQLNSTQLDVELSWVELCRYKRGLSEFLTQFWFIFLLNKPQFHNS